jgi:prepilin-type N-terminal cleavage/methylation domain-containing protein
MSSHFLAHYNVTTHRLRSGFGLIELMVSISIMLLVAAIVLARQDSFNGAVLLRGQAYEVALSAREVQLNSVSAISIAGNYRTLLGLHFDTNNDAQIRIFRDSAVAPNANGFFDSGEEFGKQITIDSRFEVRGIRTVSGGSETSVSNISVVFERPNFDARFFTAGGEVNASAVEIDISKRDQVGTTLDVVRTVEITSTGQVTVQ